MQFISYLYYYYCCVGTFKAKKNVLVEEAYNINKISDKMYYYDVKEQSYLPLTSAIYNDIINSKFKI